MTTTFKYDVSFYKLKQTYILCYALFYQFRVKQMFFDLLKDSNSVCKYYFKSPSPSSTASFFRLNGLVIFVNKLLNIPLT